MNDGWMLWLILVGLSIGVVSAWLLLVRLPRDEQDVTAAERRHEAEWISDTIERYGGVAPPSLVEEVLDLHQAYLHDPRAPQDPYPDEDGAVTATDRTGGQRAQPPAAGHPRTAGPPSPAGPPPAAGLPPPAGLPPAAGLPPPAGPPPARQPQPGYQPPGAPGRSPTTR